MTYPWAKYRTDGHLTSNREIDLPQLNACPQGLPDAVDLRRFGTRVEDQGMLGSCVANAFVSALEYGLIAGAMAVIIVAVFATFGNGLSDAFTNVTEQMQDSSTALTGAGFGGGGEGGGDAE